MKIKNSSSLCAFAKAASNRNGSILTCENSAVTRTSRREMARGYLFFSVPVSDQELHAAFANIGARETALPDGGIANSNQDASLRATVRAINVVSTYSSISCNLKDCQAFLYLKRAEHLSRLRPKDSMPHERG